MKYQINKNVLTEKPKKLLSNGSSNAKTVKNSLKTFIMYLMPFNLNSFGINICVKASKGCAAACLAHTGRIQMFKSIVEARQRKTEYYLRHKQSFFDMLAKEIMAKYKTAKRKGEKVAFRLNGTSDLDFVYMLKKYADLDILTLKDYAVFYDYTKILGKVKKYQGHENYFLTFSRAEDNEKEALEALSMGANVSAVFADKLPQSYKGFKVIDGDKSDDIMIKSKGVILGLKAKGKAAKEDKTGFVINTI